MTKYFEQIKKGEHRPPVYLRKVEAPSPIEGQWEVVTSRNVAAGEFIMEQTGEISMSYEVTSSKRYVTEITKNVVMDCEARGSFPEFINHGPPNCISIPYVSKGMVRLLFFAARDLDKGVPLFVNYGLNYFTLHKRPFFELAPHLVDRFVRETLQLQRFDFQLDNASLASQVKVKNLQQMIRYVYYFPDRLIELIRANKLQKQRVLTFVNWVKESAFLPPYEAIDPGYHPELLKRITSI
jgi:hypothetical protein